MEGNIAEIGVTLFAQESLGDVVFVDLPDVGTEIVQFDKFGEIESVKAVSDLFSPIGGTIVDTNPMVIDNPETVNSDPYGSGWLIKVEISDSSQLDKLMDAETYEATLD
jgi:glycine cleavage system H protein